MAYFRGKSTENRRMAGVGAKTRSAKWFFVPIFKCGKGMNTACVNLSQKNKLI